MTEQLYKIEKRYPKPGETVAYSLAGSVAQEEIGVLVPVPAPRTLAWALGEMVANPMKEYRRGASEYVYRYNAEAGELQCRIGTYLWRSASFDAEDESSTSWSPCEAEQAIVPGSREWLMALPDGTEVQHVMDRDDDNYYIKRGLIIEQWREEGATMDCTHQIKALLDSGWRLRTQPQASLKRDPYETWAEEVENRRDAIEQKVATLEQRVERLERMMEASNG